MTLKEQILGWHHQGIQCHYLSRNDRQNNTLRNSCLTEGLHELKVNQSDASQKPPSEALHTRPAGGKHPIVLACFHLALKKQHFKDQKGNTKHRVTENSKCISLAEFVTFFYPGKGPQHVGELEGWCTFLFVLGPKQSYFPYLFHLKKLFYSCFPWPLLCKPNGHRTSGLTPSETSRRLDRSSRLSHSQPNALLI